MKTTIGPCVLDFKGANALKINASPTANQLVLVEQAGAYTSDGATVTNHGPGSLMICDFVTGKDHLVAVGLTAKFTKGKGWALQPSFPTAVQLKTHTFGSVNFQVSHPMSVMTQSNSYELTLLDNIVPDGAIVRNMSNVATTTEIQIRGGANAMVLACIRSGQYAEKLHSTWVVGLLLSTTGNTTITGNSSAYPPPPPPSPVALSTFSLGAVQVEYSQTANLRFPLAGQKPDELEVVDLGCTAGNVIKNVSPLTSTMTVVRINSANGVLMQIVYNGETAKFDGTDWVLVNSPAPAARQAGANTGLNQAYGGNPSAPQNQINITQAGTQSFTYGGGTWIPVTLPGQISVERKPITSQRLTLKKCTCGTQSGPDGGICSDYCDLVRTDI